MSRAQTTASSTVIVRVPHHHVRSRAFPVRAVRPRGIELREFLAGEIEVEEPVVLSDPVPVG
jgi:hypothetical protein